ncbi:hypothetical protein CAPTEDRAFT_218166 [Capitella teleta]|uniref:Uncharacterized protein n=1 Tax=Capitella teleta TaxID=283909 RepID=R7TWI3_CAPTE|nr:hypothetical protein CAPTEDRAFT_218166 [Capitella teleta]|eukprot:ELT97957.1 hypothetical protein CAPTEDRAFT_218166 [Capitella teleta]
MLSMTPREQDLALLGIIFAGIVNSIDIECTKRKEQKRAEESARGLTTQCKERMFATRLSYSCTRVSQFMKNHTETKTLGSRTAPPSDQIPATFSMAKVPRHTPPIPPPGLDYKRREYLLIRPLVEDSEDKDLADQICPDPGPPPRKRALPVSDDELSQ